MTEEPQIIPLIAPICRAKAQRRREPAMREKADIAPIYELFVRNPPRR